MKLKLSVYPAVANGNKCWKIDYRDASNTRVRRYFKTKTDAEAEVERIKDHLKEGGEVLTTSSDERSEASRVLAALKEDGISISDLYNSYKNGEMIRPDQTRTIARAIEETVAAKYAANLSQDYVKELGNYLRQFARGRESMLVSQVTGAVIEQWFTDRGEKPETRQSNLGRLGSLFSFCVRRGYIKDSPVKRVEHVKVFRKSPTSLTVAQAELLLRTCQEKTPSYLAFITLGLMAGIRPEELELLKWKDVHLADRIVIVPPEISKVHQRRIIELDPTAIEWLQLCVKLKSRLPITEISRKRHTVRMRQWLGYKKWPQDVLRHTAASMLIAKHQDAGKVALWLGNQPSVLLRHYRAIVTKDVAAKFWNIKP